jgi:predicted ATPase/DNA-binding CsgD family transcriptional regulator
MNNWQLSDTGQHHSLTEREQAILQRLSIGLSDQQIADELFLSLNTIKWYNRQIYSKLGVSSRTQAIACAKDLGLLEKPAAASPPVPPHNLPAQTTPFVGRSREIAEVKRLLSNSRMLTLTGTGGVGKTRLALQAISEVIRDFADGVYFIDLAPLSDHALVVEAITGALGVVENSTQPLLDVLKRALGRREALLLIDNFEHVIEAAPVVSELLAACSRLKVLVTSRESLRLSGEQEYLVPPLSLPMADADALRSLTDSEAGLLFVQRAQMKRQHFEVNRDNAPAIVQICTRLDGLPLALELAAARCKLLPPQALVERLEGTRGSSPLHALVSGSRDAPPRHRTLWDTIAWSYNLLDEDEKRLFERLAVFRGGRSLDAIEAVCAENLSTDVYDVLASLLDKNLLQQKESPDGEPRFVLLEMIHEFAHERLEAGGEAESMRRRHAEYFVALAEGAEPELRLARYDYWCQRFEREVDNFRAALEWTLAGGDVTLGVRLANALGLFWYGQGYHVEGFRWIEQLLKRLDEVPVIYHPQFLFSAGHMTYLHDLDAAKPIFLKELHISRELGDKVQIAWALIFLGYVMQREPAAALPLAEEGLALFRELSHQPGIAQALNIIGEIARINGDDDRAKLAYEQCLAVCQQTGEGRRMCYMYFGLSHIAQHKGNHAHALDFVLRGLHLARERRDANEMAEGVAVLAGAFSLLGQAQGAANLLGASEAAYERIGAFHHPSRRPEIDRIIAEVSAQLEPAAFASAWAEGRAMTLEQAVADALDETTSASPLTD